MYRYTNGNFILACTLFLADLTSLLPGLLDSHVKSGFATKLLKEVISDQSSTIEHIEYVLFDMRIESSMKPPHFSASSVSPGSLLRREMFSLRVYKELAECGMTVTGQYNKNLYEQLTYSSLTKDPLDWNME